MTTNAIPTAIRRTQYAVFAVAAIHVLALGLVLTHHDAIRAGQAVLHPAGDLGPLTQAATIQLALPHLLFAILMPLRARRLAYSRAKSRMVLTLVLAVQIVLTVTTSSTAAQLPGLGAWIYALQAASLVFEITALAYLWSPQGRAFFRPTAQLTPTGEPATVPPIAPPAAATRATPVATHEPSLIR